MRSEGGVSGFLHRDFDLTAPSRALALKQRRSASGVEVDVGEEIDDRGAGFDRRAIGKAGRAIRPDMAWIVRSIARLSQSDALSP
jgi:hypothetical protein